jgi:hypothetical protein
VYEAVEDYKRQNAANDVGLLTDDPSLVWVVLAIAGAAIDTAALSAAFKAAKPIAEATTVFNKTGDVVQLEKDLATIADISTQVRSNILKAAKARAQAKEMLKSVLRPTGGMARMVILPGGEEFAKLVATAYYFTKAKVYDFGAFILELKAAKLIDESVGLTADELTILKKAFEKSKSIKDVDPFLAGQIEKAIAENDFKLVEHLLNTKTTIKGSSKVLPHEARQSRQIGDLLGGGEFEMIDSKRGIEGFLHNGKESIPISLKEYNTDNLKNVFRGIRDNAIKISDESVNDSRIILGGQPNSILYAEILNFDKADILAHIAKSAENILPPKSVFKEVFVKSRDGYVFTIPLQ